MRERLDKIEADICKLVKALNDLKHRQIIEVHHHHHGDVAAHGELLNKLGELLAGQKKGFNMVRQEIKDFSAQVDAATTKIGARITKLIEASTTLDSEEKSVLTAIAANLTAMGKDPEAPIPPLPPV